mgnify:CR=1 FL=1
MLASATQALQAFSLVLASGSPRRRELLTQMLPSPITFRIETSGFAEDLDKALYPEPSDYVMETARCKGIDVFGKCEDDALVIAADTVVVHQGKIMEKPHSEEEARSMLRSLSGQTHSVYTGVALFRKGHTPRLFFESTAVTFSQLDDDVIAAYVATGESMDKAGAYGAQGQAGCFVERFDGDYFNVVGLPMNRLSRELKSFILQS